MAVQSRSTAIRKTERALSCKPFLKWAGGKRQLLPVLHARLPEGYSRYFEPMLGGGALFFSLQPEQAFLNDSNPELINLYSVVRDHLDELIEDLSKHVYEKEYFYAIRDIDRESSYREWGRVAKASRFLYLNRCCFNGLYRVNAKGQFNVPFGRYANPTICDVPVLQACSSALRGVELTCGSFKAIETVVQQGDFVYFDPPYVPLSETANFTGYSKDGFGEERQVELRDFCRLLDRKGVRFLLSNSSAPAVLELYRDFKVEFVDASRAINSAAERRGAVKEVLVRNY